MLSSARVVPMIGTTDPARARAFYRDLLGFRLVSEDGFPLVFDAGGTTLRVTRVERATVAPYTVLGWLVTDIGAVLTDLRARGVTFLRVEGMEQDEPGIWSAPGGAKVAWFHDPEGHVLSLTQE